MADDDPIEVEVDVVSEQVVIGAAVAGWDDGTMDGLARNLTPDFFLAAAHAAIWSSLLDMRRKRLSWDPATFRQVVADRDATKLLATICRKRPDVPENLDFHVAVVSANRCRATALQGPIAALLAELRDPKWDPERALSIARQIPVTLGSAQNRKYLRDPDELVREQMRKIDARVDGRAVYPYGIDGLDYYESVEAATEAGVQNAASLADSKGRVRRCLPGAEPGYITLVSTMTGGGKSTTAQQLTLGSARQRRRVLYCAFEPKEGLTLESMAANVLGWSRMRLMQNGVKPGPDRELLQETMEKISKYVRFLSKEAFHGDGSLSKRDRHHGGNSENIDRLASFVADAGCTHVVADLWDYILVDDEKPSDVSRALKYQQRVCEAANFHLFLLQQQTHKQQEGKPRPTRGGVKGSGAYLEVADAFLAPFIPSLFKPGIPRDRFELYVLKQRYGLWPVGVEFKWEADIGRISGGRSVAYDQFETAQGSAFDDFVRPKKQQGRSAWKKA